MTQFDSSPIFIGGHGRSGTTLLSVMLDSHPNLVIAPEFHFAGPPNLGPHVLDCYLQLKRKSSSRFWGRLTATLPLGQRTEMKPGRQFIRRCERAGVTPETLIGLIRDVMKSTGSELADFHHRCALIEAIGDYLCKRSGKSRWGLKVMTHLAAIERYAHVWPRARFLHIVRDGRDVAASQMLEHKNWGFPNAQHAAEAWVRLIDRIRQHAEGLPYLEIRYEDLVNRTAETMKQVLEFCGEPWSSAVLRHEQNSHAILDSPVHHPSRQAVSQPVSDLAVGRYRRDLSWGQIATFNRIAGDRLRDYGYPLDRPKRRKLNDFEQANGQLSYALPKHRVRLELGAAGCTTTSQCITAVGRFQKRLVGRYVAARSPSQDQIIAAVLDLRDLTEEDYRGILRQISKGGAMHDAKKSQRQGFLCKQFVRSNFIPDIVDINHSKSERCGKPMRDAYLKSIDQMGGPPSSRLPLLDPSCPLHYDCWWGVFAPSDGYRQGAVQTDERLIAYIQLKRFGNLAIYSLILGHGDFLKHGIMYQLHLSVMHWLMARGNNTVQGIDYLMYAGYQQGGEGLRLWKRRVGFEPALLLLDDANEAHMTMTMHLRSRLSEIARAVRRRFLRSGARNR